MSVSSFSFFFFFSFLFRLLLLSNAVIDATGRKQLDFNGVRLGTRRSKAARRGCFAFAMIDLRPIIYSLRYPEASGYIVTHGRGPRWRYKLSRGTLIRHGDWLPDRLARFVTGYHHYHRLYYYQYRSRRGRFKTDFQLCSGAGYFFILPPAVPMKFRSAGQFLLHRDLRCGSSKR